MKKYLVAICDPAQRELPEHIEAHKIKTKNTVCRGDLLDLPAGQFEVRQVQHKHIRKPYAKKRTPETILYVVAKTNKKP